MGNLNRFVKPESTRIPLSDGDWIEVHTDLNTGEQKRLEAAGMKPPVMLDGKPFTPIDWEVYELERAIIFLTDWSLRGPDDKPVTLSRDALKALQPESFDEINRAIFKHVADQAAKKAERKANQETAPPPLPPVSDPTSSS